MKRFLLLLLLAFAMWELQAQIPYFASTAGDGKLYGYTSLKLRPGINTQETYTTFQYGIGNSVALGTDIYTGVGSNYMGFLARYGVSLSKWFNVGAQFTPSFNLSHNFEFGYLTSALYLNGNISRDGSWFWCANTWWGVNSGSNVKNTIDQFGIFCVEFLVDKNDNLYFLEINYRNSGWSHAMTRAGYNVVYAWCKAMLAKRLDTTDIDIPKLPYSCMVEDSEFRSNVCRGRVSLWQFLKDVKHCDYFTYWDKRDNGPFWAIMRRMFKRALKKIFN